ncbi:MAG: DNA repair protein RadA [Bacteroidetes bacterium]|jgi:DNA repair protein RadA/Sms|nr:DNA repair protein RadA [Bacteroidota bacterium]MBT6687481.1 DNA repair protein RadA [Bacteroidota bacterium]MBT7142667.1 DNA repair protein RadA [Bacteroidota bacterium]MBT7491072.1 DNA repair protein RadA [Bacteroidota bacterium]
MKKQKTSFFCQNCGVESLKWVGKCPSCNEWNTFIEEKVIKEKTQSNSKNTKTKPELISNISSLGEERIDTKINELNLILGGGLVSGSLVLIGGEPGIGKSTLVLQLALSMKEHKILYVSGEESPNQIKLRADRLNIPNENCFILAETFLDNIFSHIQNLEPQIIIVDSIQTIYSSKLESSPGSVSQIRECTAEILEFAKKSNTPVLLVGHITKDGAIAGPKVLEHIVDTVLQFEGDHNNLYRILRATKNRFGSTSELGIFEMQNSGLREVSNPSEMLLSQNSEKLSGTAIASSIEGIRPFLIEIQALVSTAAYGTPQRSSTGFDLRRLNMLLAVLEKRAGFRLSSKDVFLNIAGGLKVNDPANDLAVIVAIMSSNLDIPIEKDICFAAEIGLTGEIRPVSRIDQRIAEAEKLGFKKIFISKYNEKNIASAKYKIQTIFVGKVEDVFKQLYS